MWERNWAVARVVLQLSDDEFFGLTPRKFHLLLDQNVFRMERQEYLFGQVCQTVANFSMVKLPKPFNIIDFMPSQHRNKSTRKIVRRPRKVAKFASTIDPASIRMMFARKTVPISRG